MKELSKKQLFEENQALKTALEKSMEMLEKFKQENEFLRHKVNMLVRKVFGASSEKFDPAQLELLVMEPENVPGKSEASFSEMDEEGAAHGRKTSVTSAVRRTPENLPVIEEVLDPPEVQ